MFKRCRISETVWSQGADHKEISRRSLRTGITNKLAKSRRQFIKAFAGICAHRKDLELLIPQLECAELLLRALDVHLVGHDNPWALAESRVVQVEFLSQCLQIRN